MASGRVPNTMEIVFFKGIILLLATEESKVNYEQRREDEEMELRGTLFNNSISSASSGRWFS